MKFKISKKLLATVLAIAMVVTGFGINNTSKTTKAASLGSSGDYEVTAEEISSSVCVITKYGHVRGPLPGVTCCEAGHPVPDDNSFAATQRALALVSGLRAPPHWRNKAK